MKGMNGDEGDKNKDINAMKSMLVRDVTKNS
jgi:hypothetical protein